MNGIRQHIPNFVSGVPSQTEKFSSTEDLLAIPFVANWREAMGGKQFYRFSIGDPRMLMAEFDEGRSWWVVGYLESTDGVDLPAWQPVRDNNSAQTA